MSLSLPLRLLPLPTEHDPTAELSLALKLSVTRYKQRSDPRTGLPYYEHRAIAKPSFTGTGACLDNAYIENFFATLKKELVYQTLFQTRDQAASAIKDFILMYYNSWRLHSSLGYLCPNDFEAQSVIDLAA